MISLLRKHNRKTKSFNTAVKWERGIGAQQRCFDRADRLGHSFYIARQRPIPRGFTYEYTSFNYVDDFLQFRKGYEGNHHFNEVIREGNPCYEYYDIDASWDEFNSVQECLCAFLRLRADYQQEQQPDCSWEQVIKYEDLIVTEACNTKKLSLHVIINKNKYFKNTDEQRRWQKTFSTWVQNRFKIDMSVYNKNSVMRCIDSSKVTEPNRPLRAWGHSKKIKDKRLFFCSAVKQYHYYDPKGNVTSSILSGMEIYVPESPKQIITKSERDPIEFPQLLENVNHMIETISPSRADSYETWFPISAAIKSVLGDCQEAFDLYHYFSEGCPEKYNEDQCTLFWDKMTNSQCSKYTIGTLYNYYNLDKPKIRVGKRRLIR